MQTESIPLFRSLWQADISSLGTLQLYGIFKRKLHQSQYSWHLGATDKYLLLFDNGKSAHPSFICPFSFDIKFEILRETPWPNQNIPGRPLGIKLENEIPNQESEVLELYSQDFEMLEAWRIFLSRRLNQRSFHSLFKAKRRIGRGAFATVYLAERLIDKKMVAVKAFSKQRQYSGEQGKQSLINEIKLLRQFNDPHILEIDGVYETQNSIYVIMQILEGGQLQQRLKNKQIKQPKQIQQVIRNLLLALEALAKKNIIHRDLKPENIMFRKQDQCDLVICDFGLATAAHEEKYLFVRCGTPGFVAPEIINIRDMSTKSDPISDVFSAGLIFHLLLFNRSIFDGRKYQQILTENRACKFDFTKQLYKKVHPAALDLLKRMLQINPRLRISAQKALDHPFFSLQAANIFAQENHEMQIQNPLPFAQIDQKMNEMIDQKDQISSKYEKTTDISSKSKGFKKSNLTENFSTTIESKYKTSSFHSKKITKICSNYEKQNDQEYVPFNKKISFGCNQPELVLRRSKRSSIVERKSRGNNFN